MQLTFNPTQAANIMPIYDISTPLQVLVGALYDNRRHTGASPQMLDYGALDDYKRASIARGLAMLSPAYEEAAKAIKSAKIPGVRYATQHLNLITPDGVTHHLAEPMRPHRTTATHHRSRSVNSSKAITLTSAQWKLMYPSIKLIHVIIMHNAGLINFGGQMLTQDYIGNPYAWAYFDDILISAGFLVHEGRAIHWNISPGNKTMSTDYHDITYESAMRILQAVITNPFCADSTTVSLCHDIVADYKLEELAAKN